MTPVQLETAARARYNATNDPFFTQAMVLDIIYQAQMEMALEAHVIERTYSTTSTISVREYSYPTNAIAIRRVEYNGVKLMPSQLEYDPKTNTTAPTGTPGSYAIWNGELILFPTPAATADVIKVFTYNEPQPVTASSTLEVPTKYHLKMIDFILSIFYAKDQNEQMATYHRNLWERSISIIKRSQAKDKYGDQLAVVRDAASTPAYPGIVY